MHLNHSVRVLAAILATGACAVFFAPAALSGPPNLCHPVDIAEARSLPFGDDAFEYGSLAVADVSRRTLETLDSSGDALVHMETVRRAWVYLARKGDNDLDRMSGLLGKLRDRIVEVEVEDASNERRALAWFDYGYAISVFKEGGMQTSLSRTRYLCKGARLAPENAALRFGIAKGVFMKDRPAFYEHLLAAADNADMNQLVRANVRSVLQHLDPVLVDEDFDVLRTNLARKTGAKQKTTKRKTSRR